MAFEVITTGKNENYGKAGVKRILADNHLMFCMKSDIIFPDVKYVGDYKSGQVLSPKVKEMVMPIKKVDVLKVLEKQNEKMEKLIAEVACLGKVQKKLIILVEENKKCL